MGWGTASTGSATPRGGGGGFFSMLTPRTGTISMPSIGSMTPRGGGAVSGANTPRGGNATGVHPLLTPRGSSTAYAGTPATTPRGSAAAASTAYFSILQAAKNRIAKPLCSSSGFNFYFVPRLQDVSEKRTISVAPDPSASLAKQRAYIVDPSMFPNVEFLRIRVRYHSPFANDPDNGLILAEENLKLVEGEDLPVRTISQIRAALLRGIRQKINAYQSVLDEYFPLDLTSTPVHCLFTAPMEEFFDEATDDYPDIETDHAKMYDLKEDPYAYEAMRLLPPPLLRHKEKPLLRFTFDKAPNKRHHMEMRGYVPKPTKHVMERLKKRPAATMLLNRYTYSVTKDSLRKHKSDLFPFPRESRRMRFETPSRREVVMRLQHQEDWDYLYGLYDFLIESVNALSQNHRVIAEDTQGFVDRYYEAKLVRESGGVTRRLFDLCHEIRNVYDAGRKKEEIAESSLFLDAAAPVPDQELERLKARQVSFGRDVGFFKIVEEDEDLRGQVENHLLQRPNDCMEFKLQLVEKVDVKTGGYQIMATNHMKEAFFASLSADPDARVRGEMLLKSNESFELTVLAITELLTATKASLQVLASGGSWDRSANVVEIQTQIDVITAAFVYLKNRCAKAWAYATTRRTSRDDFSVGDKSAAALPAEGASTAADRHFLRSHLLELVRGTWEFLMTEMEPLARRLAVLESSQKTDQTPTQGVPVVANFSNLKPSESSEGKLRKAAEKATLSWPKFLQEIVKLVARKDLKGKIDAAAAEVDLVSGATLPAFDEVLEAQVLIGLQSLLVDPTASQPKKMFLDDVAAMLRQQPLTVPVTKSAQDEALCGVFAFQKEYFQLHALLLFLRGVFKAQETSRMTKPEVMLGLNRAFLPLLQVLNAKLVPVIQLLVQVQEVAPGNGDRPEQEVLHQNLLRASWLVKIFELTRLSLKVYHHAVYAELDDYCERNLTPWMEFLYVVISADIVNKTTGALQIAHFGNKEYLEKCRPAKCFKWALRCVYCFFHRHYQAAVKDGSVAEANSFASEFKNKYSLELTKATLCTLERVFIPEQGKSLILAILTEACDLGACFAKLKPEMQIVIERVCFPLLSFSDDDLDLMRRDGLAFVREQFDFCSYVKTSRNAAERFIRVVAKHRTQAVFLQTLGFLRGVLERNDSAARERDGALAMLGLLNKVCLFELLRNHVYPELRSPHFVCRYRALCTVARFAGDVLNASNGGIGGGAANEQDFATLARTVVADMICSDREEWVLRTQACIELRAFIEAVAKGKARNKQPSSSGGGPLLSPAFLSEIHLLLHQHMQQILVQIIERSQALPCDELPETLSALSSHFPQVVFPFVGELMGKLVETVIESLDEDEDDQVHLHVESMMGAITHLVKLLVDNASWSPQQITDRAQHLEQQQQPLGSSSIPEQDEQRLQAQHVEQQEAARNLVLAGLAMAPLIEKVVQTGKEEDYIDMLAEVLAMVTFKCEFHEELVQMVVRFAYLTSCVGVFSVVEEEDGGTVGRGATTVEVLLQPGEGLEQIEFLHPMLRNVMLRFPREVAQMRFFIPSIANAFGKFSSLCSCQNSGGGSVAESRIRSRQIPPAADKTGLQTLDARTEVFFGKQWGDEGSWFQMAVVPTGSARLVLPHSGFATDDGGGVPERGHLSIFDVAYDVALLCMQKNFLENRFGFQLLYPCFKWALEMSEGWSSNRDDQGQQSAAADVVGRVRFKLRRVLRLVWRAVFELEETDRRLRRIYLAELVKFLLVAPKEVVGGFLHGVDDAGSSRLLRFCEAVFFTDDFVAWAGKKKLSALVEYFLQNRQQLLEENMTRTIGTQGAGASSPSDPAIAERLRAKLVELQQKFASEGANPSINAGAQQLLADATTSTRERSDSDEDVDGGADGSSSEGDLEEDFADAFFAVDENEDVGG
eukprot:g18297.t1